jgi:hypothetical protein
LFQISLWCENGVAAWLYAVICKQLLISNDRNMVRWVVLGLPQAGACTDLLENLSEISLKGDLSNATTFNPPHFSSVNTFIGQFFPKLAKIFATQGAPETVTSFLRFTLIAETTAVNFATDVNGAIGNLPPVSLHGRP